MWPLWLLVSKPQYPLESFPELRIEDCVDEWVDAGVDVTQPRGDYESCVAREPVKVVLDADGVDDVASEERNPTNQKTH